MNESNEILVAVEKIFDPEIKRLLTDFKALRQSAKRATQPEIRFGYLLASDVLLETLLSYPQVSDWFGNRGLR